MSGNEAKVQYITASHTTGFMTTLLTLPRVMIHISQTSLCETGQRIALEECAVRYTLECLLSAVKKFFHILRDYTEW